VTTARLISVGPVPDDAKRLTASEWHKDLLVSWLFQTAIRLQKSLDRRFLKFGMTMQEASVLLCCIEAGQSTPGKLANALGRDKGKITRLIDRLEASRLVTREVNARDKRFSVIKPTGKGKHLAVDLAYTADMTRKELFTGIEDQEVRWMGQLLPQLHKNAARIGSRKERGKAPRRRRIGIRGRERASPETRKLQTAGDNATPAMEHADCKNEPIEQGQGSEANKARGTFGGQREESGLR